MVVDPGSPVGLTHESQTVTAVQVILSNVIATGVLHDA